MAIENATQNLRDNNPSGLDKSLLLPSVREQMEQQNQNPVGGDSQKIFKVLNDIAGLIDDGNLAIVDALGDVNATLGLILSKTGNVRKYGALGALGNNMITRGIGQVGRFVTAPIRGASSLISGAANTITSIARKPLDIVSGAASTARNLIGAPFRGIGNIAKNMFTNKDQKKLVELAIEDLGIQKEQLEVQKETRDEVQALHKTYKDELKRRRRGNLDSLESRRDKRRGAGLMGAAAVGAAASRDKSSGGIGQMLKNLLGKAAAALGIGGATAYGGKKLFDKLKGKPTGDMDGDDKTKSNDKNNKDNNRDKGKSKIDKGGFKFKNLLKGGPLAILGGLLTLNEIAQIQTDENLTEDEKTVETARMTGGGIGGMLAGMATGGAMGALGFNPFTVAGGVIAGGYLGYKGGEMAGEAIGENMIAPDPDMLTRVYTSKSSAEAAMAKSPDPSMYEVVEIPNKGGMRRGRRFKVAVKNYDDSIQRMGRGMGATAAGAILSSTPPEVQTTAPVSPVSVTGTLGAMNLPTPNDVLPRMSPPTLVSPSDVIPQIPMMGGPMKSFLMSQDQQDQLIGAKSAAQQIWSQVSKGDIVKFDDEGNASFDLSKFKPIKYTDTKGAVVTIPDPVKTFNLFNPNAEGDMRYQPIFNPSNIRQAVAKTFPLVGVGTTDTGPEDLSKPITITGDSMQFVPLERPPSITPGDQSSLQPNLLNEQQQSNLLNTNNASIVAPVVAPNNSNTTNVSNNSTTVLAGGSTSTVDTFSKVVPI